MQSTLEEQDGLHVAIIMDGNGRWAERRGLSRSAGHRERIHLTGCNGGQQRRRHQPGRIDVLAEQGRDGGHPEDPTFLEPEAPR